MGYNKSLPITKRSAFKKVPKGAKITGSSTDSYIEADPTGGLSDVTVTSTDYITPGSAGLTNPGSPEFQAAFGKAREEGLSQFEFGGGVYTTELAKPKSPDVPGTDEDITKKPIMTTDPGQPKKTGDAFYAPERRKSVRDAKIIRNKMIQDLKRKKRKGNLGGLDFDTEVQKIENQYTKNLQSISDMGAKQFEQGINPRTKRSVVTQEAKDATTRRKTIDDLTAAEKAKLKSTTSTKTPAAGNPSLLTKSIIAGVNLGTDLFNEQQVKSFNKITEAAKSGFPMKSTFKMAGFGKKNKK